MTEITVQQLEKLRHTLGLNYHDTPSRNHFHAGDEGSDPDLLALQAAGLMYSRKAPSFCDENDLVFHATDEGKAYAIERQPPPVKRTVWQDFKSSDMDSFLDFLNIDSPQYEEKRVRYNPDSPTGEFREWEEHRMPYTVHYRMISSRGTGEWCETKGTAKASYKADMRARKLSAKQAGAQSA